MGIVHHTRTVIAATYRTVPNVKGKCLEHPAPRLVDTTGIAAISAMHAASASSLETGPPGQTSPQLHESPRHLVSHSCVTLVVVDWSGSGMSVAAGSTGSLGCGSSGSGSSWRPGSVGATTSA